MTEKGSPPRLPGPLAPQDIDKWHGVRKATTMMTGLEGVIMRGRLVSDGVA